MGFIEKAGLWLQFTAGVATPDQVEAVKQHHRRQTKAAVLQVAVASAVASFVGFILPNLFTEPWRPTDMHSLLSARGVLHLGTAALAGYWGYCKTAPRLWHHVNMAKDPKTENIEVLKRDLRYFFDDIMKLLITVLSVAIPALLFTKAIMWLILG